MNHCCVIYQSLNTNLMHFYPPYAPTPAGNQAHSVILLWALGGFHLCLVLNVIHFFLPCTDKLLHALVPMKDESKEQQILHMISMASSTSPTE